MIYKDSIGQELQSGDYVVYAKSSYARLAKIIDFRTTQRLTISGPSWVNAPDHECDLITISGNKTIRRTLRWRSAWGPSNRSTFYIPNRDTSSATYIDCLVRINDISYSNRKLIEEREREDR